MKLEDLTGEQLDRKIKQTIKGLELLYRERFKREWCINDEETYQDSYHKSRQS